MQEVLLTWVGAADLRAPTEFATSGAGPLAQAVTQMNFDRVHVLSNYPPEQVAAYRAWLEPQTRARLDIEQVVLPSPTDFRGIYQAARAAAARFATPPNGPARLTYHLSPGTPAMAAVWILLGKTRFPGQFIESSRDHGVKHAPIPFDIAADFLPDLLADRDARLREAAAATPPAAPEFSDILHRSPVMTRLVARARRVAEHEVPVLIEGESGTGKELFARAIHRASPRAGRPFVAVNCGAIPGSLLEAELFGHERGAFTGADKARAGLFEAADGGTLFLDELAELPLDAQVKLLRVLQEGQVVRVGTTKPIKVSVRIIGATHRDLIAEVQAGRFREDLFFRLAVALLKVPPLRDREGDLALLLDHLLRDLQSSSSTRTPKSLSAAARNLALIHQWPGNVRELKNTLQRALLWSDGDVVTGDEFAEALLPLAAPKPDLLSQPLGGAFDIRALVDDVVRHYLARAMADARDNKTQAAKLLGLPSYQTLSNWLKKHGVASRDASPAEPHSS